MIVLIIAVTRQDETMARKVFFSFHYALDSWRVAQVRNSVVVSRYEKSFYDKAKWEAIKRQGDDNVRRWIDLQLVGTSVTVVLIGTKTASRRWVKYEIAKSVELGKGLIGIDISKITDNSGNTSVTGINPLPSGYPMYKWNNDNGRHNLGNWIEAAAKEAGR
jgi:hypothetical protein